MDPARNIVLIHLSTPRSFCVLHSCLPTTLPMQVKCMAAQDFSDDTLGCYWGSGSCTQYTFSVCSNHTHAEACLDTYPANLCTWDNTSYSPCGAVDPQPPQPLAPASSRRLSTAALDSTEVDSTALDSTALDSTGTGRRLLKNSLDIISRRATTYTKADCAQYANPVYGKDDKKCCEGMIAAGKKKCISADTDQACKDSANSWTAGIIAIIFSILGCAGACAGNSCTCTTKLQHLVIQYHSTLILDKTDLTLIRRLQQLLWHRILL